MQAVKSLSKGLSENKLATACSRSAGFEANPRSKWHIYFQTTPNTHGPQSNPFTHKQSVRRRRTRRVPERGRVRRRRFPQLDRIQQAVARHTSFRLYCTMSAFQ